jgi:intracellular sulfur oxidation DsrE/DsrF family protein
LEITMNGFNQIDRTSASTRRAHIETVARLAIATAVTLLSPLSATGEQAPASLTESAHAPGRPLPGADYKVVFDYNTPFAPGGINPGLAALETLANVYEKYGVAPSHRHFVVVLDHGFTDIVLSDKSYGTPQGGAANPNLPAVARLMRRGVKWVVPKPDAVKSGLTDADLYPGVEVGPTADFLFINLEAQGYVFTGTKSLDGP